MSMKNRPAIAAFLSLAGALLLAGWTAFHLELAASFPEADQSLAEAPAEIWLEFSVMPDMERSSFSVRGPDGKVDLGEISVGDTPEVVRADVVGAMPPGSYTLSWVGAPMEDHAVRGRFTFSVGESR